MVTAHVKYLLRKEWLVSVLAVNLKKQWFVCYEFAFGKRHNTEGNRGTWFGVKIWGIK